ncbi:hypothetical protein COV17_03255 [Candidatus Woesearchaeota archaeon CG10_big_fil_rev_8_21_14_0_10_36_11]|nr:MAG: hypothetical protein COV17_03255 [Candidatus Woesearchaeota archaeon CG10_big_fil_rev_8_21_14_0_10_36_11]
MNSFVIRIGGEAGWGIATAADIIAKVFIKAGYHVFLHKEYASQIKGGHNYHTIRVSSIPIAAPIEHVNVLLALDSATGEKHTTFVVDGGTIIFNDSVEIRTTKRNVHYVPLQITKIQQESIEKNVANAIFVGAAVKLCSIGYDILESVMEDIFKHKPVLLETFRTAVQKGYNSIEKSNTINFPALKKSLSLGFYTGNDAITQGALDAGITFHAQYPMTPVSKILHNLAKDAITTEALTVVQPEDEIAAINMALGASYAGARAMTATSGGGFSLMVESVGLASMAEIPLVLIEGQRPGPATGIPTKTEQGDLSFVLSAGQGDFPRVVIAPGNVQECYTETKRAFYIAEKYQLPVIVLVDTAVAESFVTVTLSDDLHIDFSQRFNIINTVGNSQIKDGMFMRYEGEPLLRTVPGTKNGMYTCAGDEHTEVGCITEDPTIRTSMMRRRMDKLNLIETELPPPELYGSSDADVTVVCWGSTTSAVKEVVDTLNSEGKKINLLQMKYMCPFHTTTVHDILKKSKKTILIENNYSGQLGRLIKEQTGIAMHETITKYNGQPFTVDEVYKLIIQKW